MNPTEVFTPGKYDFIITRILKTIKSYAIGSDELGLLYLELKEYLSAMEDLPIIDKMENVCDFLQIKGLNSFLIREIHKEACKDMTALRMNIEIDTSQTIYWE